MLNKLMIIWILFLPSLTQARVFSLYDETVASYFKGTYGASSILQTPFGGSSGTGATIASSFTSNLSGEVGVVIASTHAAFILAVELIHPRALSHVEGVDASAAPLYYLDADVSAMIPKAGIDFVLKHSQHWRVLLSVAGGVGTLSYSNHYSFTTEGNTAFSNLAEFTEEGSGTATLYQYSLGVEFLLSDSTTLVIEAGSRQLEFINLKYKKDFTGFTGAHTNGEEVYNADASSKVIDMGGAYAGLSFRFYLGN